MRKQGLVIQSLMSAFIICMFVTSGQAATTTSTGSTGANSFNMEQTLSDGAQRTTIAFAGRGMMTGNLEAQSFFPPGKVADYTGFQHLRDNDPDRMGHNTSFLTRVANNVLYILTDAQLGELKTLATSQISQINQYGYKRFMLMKAFRRLMDGDIPSGTTGLDLEAVESVSRELYELDGQISFDRAVLYSNIFRGLSTSQKSYLDNMKGKGWNSWPDVQDTLVRDKMRGLSRDESVAVMTYAGDLFSWYAGSVEADVYFCPERHGTYYGSFYMKDAPAIGHEGYSINEQLTATAGMALSDSSKGYVTASQAEKMSSLVETQRNNLYNGSLNILQARTDIATALRSLISTNAPSDAYKAQIKSLVLAKSDVYGDLDGENNYNYATVFASIYKTLTTTQKAKLATLRKSIMSGTYSDGTAFDFSVCTTPFLFSAAITDTSVLAPYVSDTDFLFTSSSSPVVATLSASSVTSTSAILSGTVNPNGTSARCYFQYGPKTTYGSVTNALSINAGSSSYSVATSVTGLIPGSTYHFRLVSEGSSGTVYGEDKIFTTSGIAPVAATVAATAITKASATLNASVNPNGTATTYYFQYGTSANYGQTTAVKSAGSGTSAIQAAVNVSGLTSNTTYYYRVVAKNASGTVYGVSQSFKTAALTPKPGTR